MPPPIEDEEDEDDEEEDDHGDTLCGACGDNYASNEFRICCDFCETQTLLLLLVVILIGLDRVSFSSESKKGVDGFGEPLLDHQENGVGGLHDANHELFFPCLNTLHKI